jgi:hypothetical protein
MPFTSKRQARAAFAGVIPNLTKDQVKEWAMKTDFDALPERAPDEKGKPTMRSKAKTALLAALTVPEIVESFKLAAMGTIKSTAKNVGRFSGMMTAHALKPPGPALSSTVINPRRNLNAAMTSFKATKTS